MQTALKMVDRHSVPRGQMHRQPVRVKQPKKSKIIQRLSVSAPN